MAENSVYLIRDPEGLAIFVGYLRGDVLAVRADMYPLRRDRAWPPGVRLVRFIEESPDLVDGGLTYRVEDVGFREQVPDDTPPPAPTGPVLRFKTRPPDPDSVPKVIDGVPHMWWRGDWVSIDVAIVSSHVLCRRAAHLARMFVIGSRPPSPPSDD